LNFRIILLIMMTILVSEVASALVVSFDYGMNKTKGYDCLDHVPSTYVIGLDRIEFTNDKLVNNDVFSNGNSWINNGGSAVYYYWNGAYRIRIADYQSNDLCMKLYHELGHHYDYYVLAQNGYLMNGLNSEAERFADDFSNKISKAFDSKIEIREVTKYVNNTVFVPIDRKVVLVRENAWNRFINSIKRIFA
jgi:hypothetical protein